MFFRIAQGEKISKRHGTWKCPGKKVEWVLQGSSSLKRRKTVRRSRILVMEYLCGVGEITGNQGVLERLDSKLIFLTVLKLLYFS